MTRYEFLKACGFTGGALLALLTSCTQEEDSFVNALIQNPDGTFSNADGSPLYPENNLGPDEQFTISSEELEKISFLYIIDTSSPLYSRLLQRNNYMVIANTYVVALSRTGEFLAATVVCSHENNRSITYRSGEWFCPQHGARYNTSGVGQNDYGKNGIKVYKTAFDGKRIIIYE